MQFNPRLVEVAGDKMFVKPSEELGLIYEAGFGVNCVNSVIHLIYIRMVTEQVMLNVIDQPDQKHHLLTNQFSGIAVIIHRGSCTVHWLVG